MLPAPISRFLWRWLRRAMVEPGPDLRTGGIERYSVFQGSLHLKGALEAPARVKALALHLPGGEILSLRFDPPGPGMVGFDQVIAVPGTPHEVAHATLVATLEGGGEVRLQGLGTAQADPAHALSGDFQQLVHARPP